MNANQTKVAQGVAKAIGTDAKKPSKPIIILTVDERIERGVALFDCMKDATIKLDEMKAFWDTARLALRAEIKETYAQFAPTPAQWSAYLKGLKLALVARSVVATPKDARTLVDNQVIALKLTGKTERAGAGGARKGAGRKVKATATVSKLSEKEVGARLVAILAFVADAQAKHAGDGEMLEVLGAIAKLANGSK